MRRCVGEKTRVATAMRRLRRIVAAALLLALVATDDEDLYFTPGIDQPATDPGEQRSHTALPANCPGGHGKE